MTSPLQVDIDVLTKTVTALRNSQQVLEDALKAMADVGAASIGTQTLDDAADSFQRRAWVGLKGVDDLGRMGECCTPGRSAHTTRAW